MPPAARIGDMHTCPMVTVLVLHFGGPIAMGLPAVLIGGMLAARLGDLTVHGGTIAMGFPQVMIG